MKTVSLSGSPRANVGKKDAKQLRKEEKVPCVIYGVSEQQHFALEEKQFKNLVYSPDVAFVEISLGEKKYKAMLKEIQFHPVTDKILHADFYELSEDKAIEMSIPVSVTGVSPGVLRGGKLIKKFRRLNVRAIPANIPEKIVIDITNLEIDDAVKIIDLKNDKFKLLHTENTIVVAVAVTRVAVAAEGDEAAAATPAK